jgi:cholesterol 7-dehydrogenase
MSCVVTLQVALMGVITGLLETVGPHVLASLRLLPNYDVIVDEVTKSALALVEFAQVLVALLSTRAVITLVGLAVLYQLLKLLFGPLEHIRRGFEVGYLTEPKQSREARAADVRRRRRTGELPPVYPNGWYVVALSNDLPVGAVKQVTCVGRELAVFRGEDGVAAVLDAYCPHLGANLAAGGTVEGNSLACPFHGWQFDKEGVCVKIPYCDHVPAGASVKKYTILEQNQQVMMW